MPISPNQVIDVLDLTSEGDADVVADEEETPAHMCTSVVIDLTQDDDTEPEVAACHASFTYAGTVHRHRARIFDILRAIRPYTVVLSSMVWDNTWLKSGVVPLGVRQWRVVEPSTGPSYGNGEHCVTRVRGRQRNHAKYALLFGPGCARFLVGSPNFTPWEWGERRWDAEPFTFENAIAWIDLPRHSSTMETVPLTRFARTLRHFLEEHGLPGHVTAALSEYSDLSTHRVGLVYSL